MLRRAALGLLALIGCRATTARPPFVPFPEAEHTEIGFGLESKVETVMQVTDTLVAYLRADSIPVGKVRAFDGYLETAWFDAATLQPTGRRPMGDGVVRVRGWVDPSKPGYARVEIETAYVPLLDPSLPARELERPVDVLHPVNKRVGEVLEKLKAKYGIPETDPKKAIQPGNRPPPVPLGRTSADSAKADSAKVDSAGVDTPRVVPADTIKVAADTSRPVVTPPKPPPPTDTARVAPPPMAKPIPTVAADAKGFWVQAAAVSNQDAADETIGKLRDLGYELVFAKRDQLILVRVGPFETRAEATAALPRVKARVGGDPFLVVNP